jgi:hypothetical protein
MIFKIAILKTLGVASLLSLLIEVPPPQIAPTEADNSLVRSAFADFNAKRFEISEKEFTTSIDRWRSLQRPRDEVVSLIKAR